MQLVRSFPFIPMPHKSLHISGLLQKLLWTEVIKNHFLRIRKLDSKDKLSWWATQETLDNYKVWYSFCFCVQIPGQEIYWSSLGQKAMVSIPEPIRVGCHFFLQCMKMKSESEVAQSRPHELKHTRLLCPCDFPGKSTGVGCHCLLDKTLDCQKTPNPREY